MLKYSCQKILFKEVTFINSIINNLNLEDKDIESIESISTTNNEDFYITLKRKNHICPNCGCLTDSIKDYKIRKLNIKIFIKFHTTVYYHTRRYICKACGNSFVENNPFGNKKQRIPNATILMALEKLKPYTSTFASVAKELDISATSVMEIFDKHVQIDRKKLTSIMCWDEFYFNRHSKYKYAFIIMDFQKNIL